MARISNPLTKGNMPAVIAAIGLAVAALPAGAQSPPNRAATGRQLGEQLCAQCHVVVPSGQAGWTDAPAFDAIANRPESTIGSLSAFIEKPHMHMINTERPPAEADAIAAYIMSLRKG